jgi:hypothetical protein
MTTLLDWFDDDGQLDRELAESLCPCMDMSCQWCIDGIVERHLKAERQYEIELLREMWSA